MNPGLTTKSWLSERSYLRKLCHCTWDLTIISFKDSNLTLGMKWRYHIQLLYVNTSSHHMAFILIVQLWLIEDVVEWQIPAIFSLQLKKGISDVGMNRLRKLLNTEKLIFKTEDLEEGAMYVLKIVVSEREIYSNCW